MKKLFISAGAALLLASCSQKSNVITITAPSGVNSEPRQAVIVPSVDGGAAYMPKATAFRMNGDYADHVAVTLDAAGNLTYYPAPGDITPASAPTVIGEGWYLNRQGLGPNSVFTKWTFEEYHALDKAPTPAEIKAAIIPGSGVTDFRRLNMTPQQAASLPAATLLRQL